MKKNFFLVMIILFGIITIGIAGAADSTELISYWSYEGDANDSTDFSDGTVTGATINTSFPIIGSSAYYFDGADDKVVADMDVGSTVEAMTICVWYNATDNSGTETLFKLTDSNGYNPVFQIRLSNDRFNVGAYTSVGSCEMYGFSTGALTFSGGVNNQYCARYNGTEFAGFLNGVKEQRMSCTGTLNTSGKLLYVGLLDNNQNDFHGLIDDVFVYNRSLSDDDINDIYTNQKNYSDIVSGGCTESITNTSWSVYTNTSCDGSNYNYSRYLTEYDSNDCGTYTNVTYWDNGTTSCSIPSFGDGLVVNLTMDNSVTNDTSGRHSWSAIGGASIITDRSVCKLYDCVNLSATSGDSLRTNTNFVVGDELTVAFWVYPLVHPVGGSGSFGFYEFGVNTGDYLYAEEGDYSLENRWDAVSGTAQFGQGSEAGGSVANVWSHYVMTYDGSRGVVYKNGVVVTNQSEALGNLLLSNNTELDVGIGIYGLDVVGYMDEFLVWNRSVSSTEAVALYDSQKAGTPPDLDIVLDSFYVDSDLSYKYDFSSENNSLNLTGDIPFVFNLSNKGINNAGSFNTTVYQDDVYLCSESNTLNAGEALSISCAASKSEGFHNLTVYIDIENSLSEDYETNNNLTLYYDFRSHPTITPPVNYTYLSLGSDNPAYVSYNVHKSFVSDNFNAGWSAADIDPRAKKGYENAINCYLNGYPSSTACTYAMNHLEGWLNGSITADDYTTDTSVQESHEVEWLSKQYDLMFNDLSLEEATVYSSAMLEVCKSLFGQSNVRPDLDGQTLNPDNGQGFYIGAAATCAVILGDVPSNPSALYTPSQSYDVKNTNYHWFRRLNGHIAANQGGDGCPEGILYCNYALYHDLWALYFDDQTNIYGINQNFARDIGGRVNPYIYLLLDVERNGGTYYGDLGNLASFVPFGDTHSYDYIGESGTVGASLISGLGYFSQNDTVRSGSLYLRNVLHDVSYGGYGEALEDLYYYALLDSAADESTEGEMQSTYGYSFEETYDNYFLRNGFGYDANDTLFGFFGGQKSGWGHPNAEFEPYVYFKGVPFLTMPQVPYDDDVRSERYHNTLSLTNSTAAGYCSSLGSANLDQYYCGANTLLLSQYGSGYYQTQSISGDLYDYFGTSDGLVGGLRATNGYELTDEMPEQKILYYDNTFIQCYTVNRSSSGYMGFSFLNYDADVNMSKSGTTLQMQGKIYTDRYHEINLLSSTEDLRLNGGNTTVKASDQKTSAGSLNFYYQRYAYETSIATDEIVCFDHQSYLSGEKISLQNITSGNDVGINRSGVLMLLDTGNDGVEGSGLSSDAWGMIVINNTHVSLNGGTWIYNGTDNNTVTTDGIVAIASSGESPEEPPEEDSTAPVISSVSAGSVGLTTARALFTTDEAANATLYFVNTDDSTDNGTVTQNDFITSHSILMSGLTPNSTYNFSLTSVCDASGNCASSYAHPFTTLNPDDAALVDDSGLAGSILPFVIILFLLSFLTVLALFLNDGEGLKDPNKIIGIIVLTVFVLLGAAIIGMLI